MKKTLMVRLVMGAGLVLVALLLMGMVLGSRAWAVDPVDFTVDTLIDEDDAGNCGDGDCSLRDAIEEAHAAGQWIIGFEPGLSGTIVLSETLGSLTIDNVFSKMTIRGPGEDVLTVSGDDKKRVFYIGPVGNATVSGLTIANGRTTAGGGGIYCDGVLALIDCTVRDNVAALGGGVHHNNGTMSVARTTIVGNRTEDGASGGDGGDGGGIYNSGHLTLVDATVSQNWTGDGDDSASNNGGHAGRGGGIYSAEAANLTLTDSTVTDNWTGDGGENQNAAATGGFGGGGGGIYSGGDLTVTGTEVNGNATGKGGAGGDGGSGGAGGGIFNWGTMTMTLSFVHDNQTGVGGMGSSQGGPGGMGGGIWNSGGTVVMNESAVSDNSTGTGGMGDADGDGGDGGNGGGICTFGVLTLTQTTVSGNSAGDGGDYDFGDPGSGQAGTGGSGGGIFNGHGFGTLGLTGCTVSGNGAGGGGILGGDAGHGGGICNEEGTVALTNCTVSGNTGGYGGSGIYSSNGMLIAGPGGSGGSGGGIYNAGSTVQLTNVTLTGNEAGPRGPGLGFGGSPDHGDGGGVYEGSGETTYLQNTILAGNATYGDGPDCWGTLKSQDYNLIQDVTDCTPVGNTAGNIVGEDAMLDGLALNPPGNTETHALLGGSPAIDAIPPLSCTVTTDQRGVGRPYGDGCDIGAYEYEPPAPVGGFSVAPPDRRARLVGWLGLAALVELVALGLAVRRT